MNYKKSLNHKNYECCIIGAGPAGFGVAYELIKNNITNLIIVDKNNVVGGLSRTQSFDGYRFDVGPHRFYSKNEEINTLWHEILGGDFLSVDRLTRIFYKGNYFLSTIDSAWSRKIKGSILRETFWKFFVVPLIQCIHKCPGQMLIRNCSLQFAS